MKKENIYITGIWGMLGFCLANHFKQEHNVYGCDIINNLSFNNINNFKIDIMKKDLIKKSIEYNNIDIMIHCAAMINVEECEKNPNKAYKINTNTTRELCKVAKQNDIFFIYISTDAVFDGNNTNSYTEKEKPNPLNVYGKTKLNGEKYVQNILSNYLILRTNIFGWNIQNKISFAEWIYYSLKLKKEISMFHDVYFTPIYIKSFAHILDELIEKRASGLYHIAGSEKYSKLDFAYKLAKIFNFSTEKIKIISVDSFPFQAKRAKNMSLNINKILKICDSKMFNLENGLKLFKHDKSFYDKEKCYETN